jgi:DNA helicase-2/ATP-dependent DNA helicase PcrA
VLLDQNYRSTQRILRVSGQVIAQNGRNRMLPDKQLVTENSLGEKIGIGEFAGAVEEAEWVAQEIARLHAEGHKWRGFAVLYRMHTHRDKLVDALMRREIPFVIRKLSILQNRLVRDVLAYVRLVVAPHDDVACARVLAAPAWGLEPADLARLCERTGGRQRVTLWEAARQAQNDPAFARLHERLAELVKWIGSLQRSASELDAGEFLGELVGGLGLALAPEDFDRPFLKQLEQFVREWQVKSETRGVREFVEYLELLKEAGGEIPLEEEPERDAVQLMTVHAAKGLEFEHVFVLRLVARAFPVGERPRVLEFPDDLLQEEKPQGDFKVQEERRLFYVAMTRARRRLTLTTVIHKRSKQSPFLDDILLPGGAKKEVWQFSPKVAPPDTSAAKESEQLFGAADPASRAYSRIGAWARTYRPPLSTPLQLSATSVDSYDFCPMKFLLGHQWKLRGGPRAVMTFGNVMHTAIKFLAEEIKQKGRVDFEEVAAFYEREWHGAGFLDDYQEEEYKKEGLEELRAFHASYSATPPKMLYHEKNFALPLDGDIVISGRIDQVNELEDGAAEIVDYKTGKPKNERDAKQSVQLRLYALACREALEREPARLTLYNLTTNAPVSVPHDEKQMNRAQEEVREVADDVRAGNFPAKVSPNCKGCEFFGICPEQEHRISVRPAGKGS